MTQVREQENTYNLWPKEFPLLDYAVHSSLSRTFACAVGEADILLLHVTPLCADIQAAVVHLRGWGLSSLFDQKICLSALEQLGLDDNTELFAVMINWGC